MAHHGGTSDRRTHPPCCSRATRPLGLDPHDPFDDRRRRRHRPRAPQRIKSPLPFRPNSPLLRDFLFYGRRLCRIRRRRVGLQRPGKPLPTIRTPCAHSSSHPSRLRGAPRRNPTFYRNHSPCLEKLLNPPCLEKPTISSILSRLQHGIDGRHGLSHHHQPASDSTPRARTPPPLRRSKYFPLRSRRRHRLSLLGRSVLPLQLPFFFNSLSVHRCPPSRSVSFCRAHELGPLSLGRLGLLPIPLLSLDRYACPLLVLHFVPFPTHGLDRGRYMGTRRTLSHHHRPFDRKNNSQSISPHFMGLLFDMSYCLCSFPQSLLRFHPNVMGLIP